MTIEFKAYSGSSLGSYVEHVNVRKVGASGTDGTVQMLVIG